MIAGIVLAAGASRRAGYSKALATLDGEPLVVRIARVLLEGGCDVVIAVVAPNSVVSEVLEEIDVSIAVNPDPSRGMVSSIAVGLEAAAQIDADAAIVALVDHPRVSAKTVAALIDARGANVVRPRWQGRRGHPFLIARALFDAVAHAPPEQGARVVLRDAANQVDVDVEDPFVLDDLDTPEALAEAGIAPPE